MVQQSAQAKRPGVRIDGAIYGVTPATKTIQAFALAIAEMSLEAALARTAQHIEELRESHGMEEVASIQMEHAVQHTRKCIEVLAAFQLETAKTPQDDYWLRSVTAAVPVAGAAGHAATQRAAVNE